MSVEERIVGKPLPFAEGIIVPESGTYFIWSDDAELHPTSLTIPGYTGFTKEVLKPEVLPEDYINGMIDAKLGVIENGSY